MSAYPRPVIGFISNALDSEYHLELFRAARECCFKSGWGMVYVPTGRLSPTTSIEAFRNRLYHLVPQLGCDGLVISVADLGPLSETESLERHMVGWDAIPMVVIGSKILQIPAILPADSHGIQLAMDHLVNHHGLRRIAFVQGPADNPVARERFSAYREYLYQHDLPYDSELVQGGDFGREAGLEAGRRLAGMVDRFDAVLSANDTMALGIKAILGGEKPLFGFDAIPSALGAGIASVDQALGRQVQLAFKRLGHLLDGSSAPGVMTVEPLLVPNASCGCTLPPSHSAKALAIPVAPDRQWLKELNEEAWPSLDEVRKGLGIDPGADRETILATCFTSRGFRHWAVLEMDPLRRHHALSVRVSSSEVDGHQNANGALNVIPPGWFEHAGSCVVVDALSLRDVYLGIVAVDVADQDPSLLSGPLRETVRILGEAMVLRPGVPELRPMQELEIMALRREEQRLVKILEDLPSWIIELDHNLHILYANRSGRLLLGTETGYAGRELTSFLDQRDRLSLRDALLSSDTDPAGRQILVIRFHHPREDRTTTAVCEIQAFSALDGKPGIRLSGTALSSLARNAVKPEELFWRQYDLSWREKQIMTGMIEGLDIKELAAHVGVSPNTIKGYMHRIYVKTSTKGRKELFELLNDYRGNQIHHDSWYQAVLGLLLK